MGKIFGAQAYRGEKVDTEINAHSYVYFFSAQNLSAHFKPILL